MNKTGYAIGNMQRKKVPVHKDKGAKWAVALQAKQPGGEWVTAIEAIKANGEVSYLNLWSSWRARSQMQAGC